MKRLITFSRIPSGRPAKSCRTDFGQRTGSNSNGVSRNGEVPRNKRSRKGTSPVPFLRRDRVKIKFIGEKNVREIAREEKRYRETVARFVKEEDVQEHVKEIRARFYGALEEMLLAAIEYAKKAKDGGWLAFEMLKTGGVIPQQESQNKVQIDWGRTVKSDDDLQREIGYGLVNAAIEQHKYLEMPLPEAEEMEKEILAKEGRGG